MSRISNPELANLERTDTPSAEIALFNSGFLRKVEAAGPKASQKTRARQNPLPTPLITEPNNSESAVITEQRKEAKELIIGEHVRKLNLYVQLPGEAQSELVRNFIVPFFDLRQLMSKN